MNYWGARAIRSACWLLLAVVSAAYAEVRLPNGEYTESTDDLKVKVLGGFVTVERSWTNGRWYINPAWADLKLTIDSLDGSVSALDRAGSIYERSGNGIYIFDKRFFIQTTPLGYRWYDQRGNWIAYDANGHMTAYGDRNNVQVTFQLDANGQRTQVLDHFNNPVLTFQYNGALLSGVTDRTGRRVQYVYTGNNLTQVIDVLGNTWAYTYDSNGQITSRTDPESHTTTIVYAQSTTSGTGTIGMKSYLANNLSISAGVNAKASASVSAVTTTGSTPRDYKIARVFTLTDPEGNTTTYLYAYDRTTLKYTVTQKFPGGRQVASVYDRDGWLLQRTVGTRLVYTMIRDGTQVELVTDERGLTTRVEYDSARSPLKIAYPDGTSVTATYDSVYSNVLTSTDEAGTQTVRQYDAKGNLTQMTEAVGLPEQRVTIYAYDQYGQSLTTIRKGLIPSEDATTTYSYDGFGNRATAIDPVGSRTDFTCDVMGNVVAVKDPRSNVWPRTFNGKGWLLSRADPLGNVTTFTYDRAGNRIKLVDPMGKSANYTYNKNDWRTSVTDALGGITQFQYDQEGRGVKETDPSGVVVTRSYDNDGRQTKVVDGNGNVTQTVYGDDTNALNGLTATIVYPTYQQNYKYDQRNRVVAAVQQWDLTGTRSTVFGYDAKGNVVSQTESPGKTTLFAYDAFNRLTTATDALGNVTRFTFDVRDNMRSVTDASANYTGYDYDLANHLLLETRPLGNADSKQYDAAGNLVTYTNARGEQRRYGYDFANRRISEQHFTSAVSQVPVKAIQFSYDAKGMLASYADGTSSALYTRDANGRKLSETVNYGSFSKTISYSFSANGTEESFTFPDGFQASYAYDAGNRITQIATPLGNIGYGNYQWAAPTQLIVPGISKTLSFDGLMRPNAIKVQAIGAGTPAVPQGAILLDFRYAYDDVGNIVKRSTQDGDFDYQYDSLNQLTTATPPPSLQASPAKPDGLPVESYGYDAVHNRIASQHQPGPWAYDRNNALLQFGQGQDLTQFAYNENGQVTARTQGGQSRGFGYDISERLVSVADLGTTIATYTYDPFGRRLSKTVGATVTYFQYADEGLVAEFDGNGNLTKSYGWQPGGTWGTNPQFMRTPGSLYFYHNDHLGTPQVLTDATGTVVWAATYEAFGRLSAESVASIENNLRLPGQYYDPETGTHYNFHRDYAPSTGRYLQSDPIGLRGGINVYIYAGANALTNLDPLGLVCHWHREFDRRWELAGSHTETVFEWDEKDWAYRWEAGTPPNWGGIGTPEPPLEPEVCVAVYGYELWHWRIWKNVRFEQLNLYMRQCKECGSCGGAEKICTPWENLGPISARERTDSGWYTVTDMGFFPTGSPGICVKIPVKPPGGSGPPPPPPWWALP